MNVAIVQETLDSHRGGAETSTVEMARHLARLGLDVTLLCRTAPPELRRESVPHVRVIPARSLSRTLRTYQFLRGVHRLRLHEHFDIVHAVTPCLAANVYQPRGGTYAETAERSLAQTGSPELYWLRRIGGQFNLRRRFLFHLEDTLLRRRRHRVFVAAVSDYVRRQVVAGYGFPAERTRVVFNGVDVAALTDAEIGEARAAQRAQLALPLETPLVLFAAHNFKLKGLGELIRACALRVDAGGPDQPAPGCPWVLVIAGRDRPAPYARLARHLGVAERVRFVGTNTSLRQWYAAADVLAHPTWYDPCSRVVLEALSLGVPVVTTRYNGAAEVIQADQHGTVIDHPDDISQLANGIASALRPELRARCRADAPRLLEQLSMARHARELRALYQVVAAAETERRQGP